MADSNCVGRDKWLQWYPMIAGTVTHPSNKFVAPRSTAGSDQVALYFTRALGEQRRAVHWYAPVRGHELLRRRDLLPDEPDHPRADQAYYAMQLGPLERLEPPIISLRWRRITFIETTWDPFQMAQEINELYASGCEGNRAGQQPLGYACPND
jgi:hypothetical protein